MAVQSMVQYEPELAERMRGFYLTRLSDLTPPPKACGVAS
jgi:hypothetical protein